MKYFLAGLIGLALSASVFAVPVEPESLPPENLLIVEVQTGSTESAREEFIELHNSNDTEIDLTGWLLQYKSATGENWTTRSELSGIVEPRGRYLISTEDYLVEATLDVMSHGLAKTAGHVRLLQPSPEEDGEDTIHDVLGWGGDADSAEGDLPAVAPEAGQSLKRVVDEDGHFIDTNVNQDDFKTSETPTPVSDRKPLSTRVVDEPLVEEISDKEPAHKEPASNKELAGEEANNEQGQVAALVSEPKFYAKITITELFIDPSSPKTDADDEFIELFNPGNETVQLEGYVIQTGSTFSRSFAIPNLEIRSGQYLPLYSVDTGLPLANSGSQARILDPNGVELFKTAAYDRARPDTAWALVAGTWQWTASPTPAAPNVIVALASSRNRSSSAGSSSSSARSSSSGSNSDARIVYEEPAAIANTELNTAVLAGVGTLAVGYAMYEYRRDITNRVHQFRKYLKSRR